MQLRRIVTEFPRIEPVAYAFTYADTDTYEQELDEWFTYSEIERLRLQAARQTFERRWKKFEGRSWTDVVTERQAAFMRREVAGLQSSNLNRRLKSLQTLLHVALGVWDETAGTHDPTGIDSNSSPTGEQKRRKTSATASQIEGIKHGVRLLTECGAIYHVFDLMRRTFDKIWNDEGAQSFEAEIAQWQHELHNVMTILYFMVETTRFHSEDFLATSKELLGLRPRLVDYLIMVTAKLRWDDTNELPFTRIFVLLWKSILFTFGGIPSVEIVRKAVVENSADTDAELITASPLDYHMFRQEITSKYPAYIPPKPIIPLDQDATSLLPHLPNHPSRNANGNNGILPPPSTVHSGAGSILHQPVHIATPAPSPPPSPAVGNKPGKKQNYQTNQNFPFMYPPLDATSNSAGGKGGAGTQAALVGRKWDGSDIPKSILEAGELFSRRTRMSRATRQLWEEREAFLRSERGWDDKLSKGEKDDADIDDLDLDEDIETKLKKLKLLDGDDGKEEKKVPKGVVEVDHGPRPETLPADVKAKLEAVEEFYAFCLPHLQSVVIVLLKAVLANVTALLMQPMQLPPQSALQANGAGPQRRPPEPMNPTAPVPVEVSELSNEDLNALRTREITGKAVSGIILILLKWFKVSHILKFEYLTQLLLDSNYMPLILKLFAHQDVDKSVDSNADRIELR
jgi:hypothetical protein